VHQFGIDRHRILYVGLDFGTKMAIFFGSCHYRPGCQSKESMYSIFEEMTLIEQRAKKNATLSAG
jgi:hypothetical protein